MILLYHTEKLDSILYRLPVQEQGAHFVIQVQYFIYEYMVLCDICYEWMKGKIKV